MSAIREITPVVGTEDSWTPANLNDLPEQPPIKPDLAATGLIYPGKRHVFSGPPESAKTLAAYAILIHNARQNEYSVLIDFEMGAYDARQRLRELGATPNEISRILYLEPDEPATTERIDSLVARRPTLVVIDAAAGAYDLEGLDDNQRKDVGKVAKRYISIFWTNKIATILIDHVVKNAEQRGRFQIGSERKLGASDVHLGFDTIKPISRGTTGHYKLIVHKDRGGYHKRGHLCDLHLDSHPDTHLIDWKVTDPDLTTDGSGNERRTWYMEKVSVELETRHDNPSRNDVHQAIGRRKQYVLDAIGTLVAEGFVGEQTADGSARLGLVSLRPYRESDPTCNPENTTTGSAGSVWFRSGSGNQSAEVVPVVPHPYGGNHPETTRTSTPEPQGWFHQNGHLADTDLTYLDELSFNPEDDPAR